MRRFLLSLALSVGFTAPVVAQPSKAEAAKGPPKIEDNSFLVEEAYNQEYGVVQHISTFQRTRFGAWSYAFTQEWPAPSQRHQFSYTIPMLRPDPEGSTGVGDIALNYRYQALGKDEEPLWFSPRVSLYLPTGSARKGRGAGGAGLEVMLPFSYAISDALVTHWDVGGALTRFDDGVGVRGTARGLKAAASAIWLVAPTFNLMLESVATHNEVPLGAGSYASINSYVVSPGVRGAINFASGLQIVPGIAMPIGLGSTTTTTGSSSRQRDLFLYLSFEHPFR